MNLRIVLPQFSAAIDDVIVVKWHKSVGDSVAYGDVLCDVEVQEVKRLRRSISALSRRRDEPVYGKLDVRVPYRMTSLDSGVVVSIAAADGAQVSVGEVMAALKAEGDGEGEARTVVNLLEAGAEA